MKKLAEISELFESKAYSPGDIPDDLLEECVRFRTSIYIKEGYLPEPERTTLPDSYDAQSAHICVHEKKSGQLAGYCRMIIDHPLPLPILELYPDLADHLNTPVEISRFSVLHPWRGRLNPAGMAPIFQLARELLILSRNHNLLQWSCLIDDRFQKLCERFFKMDFHVLGKPAMYMGSPTVPCLIKISESIRNNIHNPDYTAFWGAKDLQDWVQELESDES